MLRTILLTAITTIALTGAYAHTASVGVVVEVSPAGAASIRGSATGIVKTGQIIKAGDRIIMKRTGKIRILTVNRERITLRNSGTYSFSSKGRVIVLVRGKSAPRVKSVVARLRTLRGFGVSRGGAPPPDITSMNTMKLSLDIEDELRRTNMISDPYLRHLVRFYIYDRYGYTKKAAEEAKRSSKFGD